MLLVQSGKPPSHDRPRPGGALRARGRAFYPSLMMPTENAGTQKYKGPADGVRCVKQPGQSRYGKGKQAKAG